MVGNCFGLVFGEVFCCFLVDWFVFCVGEWFWLVRGC